MPNKRALYARRDPPPKLVRPGGWGKRQNFVKMLMRHPDEWFQYEPGTKHSAAQAWLFTKDFPGTRATSRKRIRGGGHNIYVKWSPDAPTESEPRWNKATVIAPEEPDPEPEDDFDWGDYT